MQYLEFGEKCDLQLSFQDHIKIIYNLVAASEIRGFIMTVYAYHYKQIQSNYTGKYTIYQSLKKCIFHFGCPIEIFCRYFCYLVIIDKSLKPTIPQHKTLFFNIIT